MSIELAKDHIEDIKRVHVRRVVAGRHTVVMMAGPVSRYAMRMEGFRRTRKMEGIVVGMAELGVGLLVVSVAAFASGTWGRGVIVLRRWPDTVHVV